MLRGRKFFEFLQRQRQSTRRDAYNAVKYMADTGSRRQQKIYADFVQALAIESQTQAHDLHTVTSGALPADPKKLATLTPLRHHFKCIAEHNEINGKNPANKSKESKRVRYDTFMRAARPILLMAQCCGGLMPVLGVRQANATQLRFSCKSLPMLLTLFYLVCSSLISLSYLRHLALIDVDAKNIVGLAFFSCVQLTCMLFLVLAVRWPQLMLVWSRTEHIFTRPPYEQPRRRLTSRLRLAALIILCCSVAEHLLYLTSAVLTYTRKQHLCGRNFTSFDDFIRNNYSYVFTVLPYHFSTGVFILLANGACTFIWNYMDLFIMMVSKGIAYLFEQITMRINQLADKEVSEHVFIEIREHYVRVCELLEQVDDHLSGIILLSNLNNLYFVCTQLLNIFNKLRWPINYVYFWYSLLYLIGRAAFVFLCAATINDESKGALSVLRRVSEKSWCTEVERLIFQMTTHTVALTGKKFYFLTRSLLFGMAGTIVTYELVLLQFDEPNRLKGLAELCAS